MSNQIEKQLDELFSLESQLHQLLESEQHDQFQQLQKMFSNKIEYLLDNNSQDLLAFNIEALKELEDKVEKLQARSLTCLNQLKDEALKQKRTRKNLKAYK
jgi:hypothetical protein